MKTSRKNIITVVSLGLSLGLFNVAGSVLAAPNQGANPNSQTNNSSPADLNSGSDRSLEVRQNEAARAKQAAELRSNRAVLSSDNRQMVCENRQDAIENKISAMGGAGQAVYRRLTTAQQTLEKYTQEHGYADVSMVDVESARVKAELAVVGFNVENYSLDCTVSDPVLSLTAVRDSAIDMREQLKQYRSELQKVMTAIEHQRNTSSQEVMDTSGVPAETEDTSADSRN